MKRHTTANAGDGPTRRRARAPLSGSGLAVAVLAVFFIFYSSFFISSSALNAGSQAEPRYDLLLRGGHVIDPRNGIDAVRDVAIRMGVIAAVESRIDPATAAQPVDVTGLYV